MTEKTGNIGIAESRFLMHGVASRAVNGMHFRHAFPTEIFVSR